MYDLETIFGFTNAQVYATSDHQADDLFAGDGFWSEKQEMESKMLFLGPWQHDSLLVSSCSIWVIFCDQIADSILSCESSTHSHVGTRLKTGHRS